MKTRKRQGVKAWLITWDWSGDHAKPEDKVVEILSPRLAPETVRQIVELLYHRGDLLTEKIAWRLRRQSQPYPAIFPISQWQYDVTCGHNPWLHARLVDNLIIETDANGKEIASWTDRHNLPEVQKMIRSMSSS